MTVHQPNSIAVAYRPNDTRAASHHIFPRPSLRSVHNVERELSVGVEVGHRQQNGLAGNDGVFLTDLHVYDQLQVCMHTYGQLRIHMHDYGRMKGSQTCSAALVASASLLARAMKTSSISSRVFCAVRGCGIALSVSASLGNTGSSQAVHT